MPKPFVPKPGLLVPVSRPAGQVTITARRITHILYGDPPFHCGHLFGAPNGKSQFPQGWDRARIIAAVLAVANDRSLQCYEQPDGALRVYGYHAGLLIRVAFNRATLSIITGFPE